MRGARGARAAGPDTDPARCAPIPAAGNCWLRQARNGRCQVLYKTDLSKEECCKSGRLTTSWTEEDVNDNTLFKWMIFNGGAPNCIPCKGEGAGSCGWLGVGVGDEGQETAALSSCCPPPRLESHPKAAAGVGGLHLLIHTGQWEMGRVIFVRGPPGSRTSLQVCFLHGSSVKGAVLLSSYAWGSLCLFLFEQF